MSEHSSRVVFWNLYEAALERRRGDERRWRAQCELVRALRPTVLMTTEGWHWSDAGSAAFHDAEDAFGMRGALFPAKTDCDMAIFWRPGVEPVRTDPLPFGQALWHGYGQAVLRLPGWDGPVRFVVAHLDPFSPTHRRIESDHLRALTDPRAEIPLVIGMDANTVPPGDPEPDWFRTPPHKRDHHRMPGETTCDREPVRRMLGSDEPLLVDAGAHRGDRSPTVGHTGSDAAARRIDLLLLSPRLIPTLTGYETVRHPLLDDTATPASDHRPVSVTLSPSPPQTREGTPC
ncbi:endonuclease/exonuclease/phosphatase family protein [Saccharopolyspora erythraea]|uniref:endonuclease/exonuclease/phosphatase family protein n=1 Tax=Saccharopolyspora erythraea TaxID=1836 RepID=UPI001BA461A7|nr:hypothetical protein [Saccharopolyspora erythraea]QUH01944.1 endonuclease/exonuclease/phosphatase family protein [Saccharopolyspora erythraea]